MPGAGWVGGLSRGGATCPPLGKRMGIRQGNGDAAHLSRLIPRLTASGKPSLNWRSWGMTGRTFQTERAIREA